MPTEARSSEICLVDLLRLFERFEYSLALYAPDKASHALTSWQSRMPVLVVPHSSSQVTAAVLTLSKRTCHSLHCPHLSKFQVSVIAESVTYDICLPMCHRPGLWPWLQQQAQSKILE